MSQHQKKQSTVWKVWTQASALEATNAERREEKSLLSYDNEYISSYCYINWTHYLEDK